MSQSLLFEATNGAFFVLAACAFFIFLHYFWKNRAEGYYFLRPAIPFLFLFGAEAGLRFAYWHARHIINNTDPTYKVSTTVAIGWSVAIAITALCVVRVYSPISWGNKSWIISLLLATAFVAMALT